MDAFDLDYFELESAEEKLTLPSWEMLKNAVKPQPVTVKSVIPITEKRKNYRITAEDILYPTGAKHKIAANISAIRLLKELEKSGRSATDEECKILIQYCGWGGIPQVFDSGNEKFSKEYAELRNILSLYSQQPLYAEIPDQLYMADCPKSRSERRRIWRIRCRSRSLYRHDAAGDQWQIHRH